jgi:hypothetical protein
MDSIWLARNKLIHEASQPNPVKTIQQLKVTLEYYCSTWKAAVLPSLWLPPGLGSLKGYFNLMLQFMLVLR